MAEKQVKQTVQVFDERGNVTIELKGQTANILAGGSGESGDVTLKNKANLQTVHLGGETGNLVLGGNGIDGDLAIHGAKGGKATIDLDGETASFVAGGNETDAVIVLKNAQGEPVLQFDAKTGSMIANGLNVIEVIQELQTKIEKLERKIEG